MKESLLCIKWCVRNISPFTSPLRLVKLTCDIRDIWSIHYTCVRFSFFRKTMQIKENLKGWILSNWIGVKFTFLPYQWTLEGEPLESEKNKFSLFISMCHLVVKFWTKSLTHLSILIFLPVILIFLSWLFTNFLTWSGICLM